MRCSSGRQRGGAVCLGDITGRCIVPRGGDLREVSAVSSLLLERVALSAPRGLLTQAYPLPRVSNVLITVAQRGPPPSAVAATATGPVTPTTRVCYVPTATPGKDTNELAWVVTVRGVPELEVEGFEPLFGAPCASPTAAVVPGALAVGASLANEEPGVSAAEGDPNMVLSHSICSGEKGLAIVVMIGSQCPPAGSTCQLCFQTATTCCMLCIVHAQTLAYLTSFPWDCGCGRPRSRR